MTDPIRPDVVALLTDLDCDATSGTWKHLDGTPATPDEIRLAMTVNRAELQAVIDYDRRAVDHGNEQIAALRRMEELTQPHFDALGAGTVMGQAMARLTPAELAEFNELAEIVAPDGWFVLATEDH